MGFMTDLEAYLHLKIAVLREECYWQNRMINLLWFGFLVSAFGLLFMIIME